MPNSRRRALGDLERAVMDVLWSAEDPEAWISVREVHEALAADRGAAYTTVMTVLDRLAGKELVEQQRQGRAYGYRPSSTRAELTADLLRDTLTELSHDQSADALTAFVREASPDEVEALRDALNRLS